MWRSWCSPMMQYSSEGFGLYHNIFQKCSSPHSYLCFYQERTAEVDATMSILSSSEWCYFFEELFALYWTRPCSSVHYAMCHWRAHQVFKLRYLLAQLFLFAYMRRHHINLETGDHSFNESLKSTGCNPNITKIFTKSYHTHDCINSWNSMLWPLSAFPVP